MRTRKLVLALLAAGTLVVGCSKSDTSETGAPQVPGSTSSTPGTTAGTTVGSAPAGSTSVTKAGFVEVSAVDSPYGKILVDDKGMTLYAFTRDTAGQPSACTGACVDGWPPVEAVEVVAGTGVDASVLAVTDDGQVTAGGHRLYLFAGDAAPGDSSGNGTGGVWFVVAPDGTPITAQA